jgi:anti-sigma B factor antagonist
MLFDVRTLQLHGWVVVSVVGEIDLATIPELRQHCERVEGEKIVLDLSGVDHFDVLGFGVVHGLQLRVARRGGRFAVVCPPGRPRELFAATGVDSLVPVVEDLDGLTVA